MSTSSNNATATRATPLFNHLGEILSTWRADAPDAPALITEDISYSVSELADLVDAQRKALSGLAPDSARIGVNASSSVASVALLYAVPASGRVLVPLNTRLIEAERAAQLDRADVALLLGDPVTGFSGPTIPLHDLTDPTNRGNQQLEPPNLRAQDPEDVAWLIFTSGSTGAPKGVLLTHASLAAAVATTAAARPLADDEVYLYPFPLFHVAAYNILHAHARRRPVVLPDRFAARRIIELCDTHQVTAMSLAATMLRMLLDEFEAAPDLSPPASLRTIAYGAAPMPATLLRQAHEKLGCDFAQGYGSTELSGNAVFLGPEAHRCGLSGEERFLHAAGYAGPGVQLRVVDDAGTAVQPGTPGELIVAADQVCVGYLNDPVATGQTINNGWLHTGDIATIDDDGLVRIVDRAKDLVVTGGENVSSLEIEEALRSHRNIAEVAVVGLQDERWGEAVTAVVVLSPGSSTPSDASTEKPSTTTITEAEPSLRDDLQEHVRERLARFKVPRNVFVATVLPRNANGKVDKPAIRAKLNELRNMSPQNESTSQSQRP